MNALTSRERWFSAPSQMTSSLATFEMAMQGLEELHHLRAFDTASVDAKAEALKGDGSDDREAFPVEGLMQHGCLPAWSPNVHTVRPGAQPRLVDEDDGALLPARFS